VTLVSLAGMLRKARCEGYAVGGFYAWNLELVQSVVNAAEGECSPAVLLINQTGLNYAGLEYYTAFAKKAAEKATVPMVLHLDHAQNLELVTQCIRCGFSSVMFDGSAFPLETNIELTRKVVEAAHGVGVSVEAELGRVPRAGNGLPVEVSEASMTDPDEARRFVDTTGIDALAISVGTVHGLYKRYARLDFNRLKRIGDLTDVPLVLHGGTGIPDDAVHKAVELGVCKINVGEALRRAYLNGLKGALGNNSGKNDVMDVLATARLETENVVRGKMRLFRSAGKAD